MYIRRISVFLQATCFPVRPGTLCAWYINPKQDDSCVMSKKGSLTMTKRMVSLLMALMLVIGIFAVPAMAAQEDEGIEPHTQWTHCSCGASVAIGSWTKSGSEYKTCKNSSSYHRHDMRYRYTGYTCGSCGRTEIMKTETLMDDCSFK